MKRTFLPMIVLALSACALPQQSMMMKTGGRRYAPAPQPVQAQQYFVDETVEVLSEPPGARIQVNDAFAGYAPARAAVRRFWRGEPGRMVLGMVKIEALPVAGGQCVQSGYFGQNSAKVPLQVSFTMTDCPSAAAAVPAGPAESAPPVSQHPAENKK